MENTNFQKWFKNSLLLRAFFMWIGLCILAIINGTFREIVIKPMISVSELTANQISCFTGVLLMTTFVFWFWKILNIKSLVHAFYIGLGWFISTFLFETFLIDRNLNWIEILNTYNMAMGQYWGLVLLWIGLMPMILFSTYDFRRTQQVH